MISIQLLILTITLNSKTRFVTFSLSVTIKLAHLNAGQWKTHRNEGKSTRRPPPLWGGTLMSFIKFGTRTSKVPLYIVYQKIFLCILSLVDLIKQRVKRLEMQNIGGWVRESNDNLRVQHLTVQNIFSSSFVTINFWLNSWCF